MSSGSAEGRKTTHPPTSSAKVTIFCAAFVGSVWPRVRSTISWSDIESVIPSETSTRNAQSSAGSSTHQYELARGNRVRNDTLFSTLVLTSGSAITPRLLNSRSPTPRVLASPPPHLLSPKESVTIPVPLFRSRMLSTRESG